MPLKGIPNQLSPELLKVLAEMGHGDEINNLAIPCPNVTQEERALICIHSGTKDNKILADIHFPTASICAKGPQQIRAEGLSATVLLEAVMKLFPLDQYVDFPVARMDLVDSDKVKGLKTPIWDRYQEILDAAEGKKIQIEFVERFDFYERAKKAFAIIHTGENQQYANIILKKGLVV